jgi:hypothetical protein
VTDNISSFFCDGQLRACMWTACVRVGPWVAWRSCGAHNYVGGYVCAWSLRRDRWVAVAQVRRVRLRRRGECYRRVHDAALGEGGRRHGRSGHLVSYFHATWFILYGDSRMTGGRMKRTPPPAATRYINFASRWQRRGSRRRRCRWSACSTTSTRTRAPGSSVPSNNYGLAPGTTPR